MTAKQNIIESTHGYQSDISAIKEDLGSLKENTAHMIYHALSDGQGKLSSMKKEAGDHAQ